MRRYISSNFILKHSFISIFKLFDQIIDASELSSKFFIIKDLLFIMEKLIRHPITLTEFEFYAKDLREIMMHVEAGTPDYRKKFFRLLGI